MTTMSSHSYRERVRSFLRMEAKDLGLDLDLIDRLVAERQEARRVQDFARADELRNELRRQGVLVQDHPGEPTFWEIVRQHG